MNDSSFDDFNGSDYRRSRPRFISPTSTLFIGLILGLIGSMAYAWLLAPVVYVGVSPARLSEQYQKEYLYLVSESFAAGSSWEQTELRLLALGDPQLDHTVAEVLDDALRSGEPAPVLRNLSSLADRLGVRSQAASAFIPRSASTSSVESNDLDPTPTLLATRPALSLSTPTVTLTREPTATPPPVYRLLSREMTCYADGDSRLLIVEVVNSRLEPLPGAEIVVSWDAGTDHFFTGFQPERGPGYADFLMEEGVSYRVEMAGGSTVIFQIQVESCDEGPQSYLGGWRLLFQNTDVLQDGPGSGG